LTFVVVVRCVVDFVLLFVAICVVVALRVVTLLLVTLFVTVALLLRFVDFCDLLRCLRCV